MDSAPFLLTIFGSLVSILLTVVSGIGFFMLREMRELRTTVTNHGQQLAAINATLAHIPKRSTDLA